MSKLVEVELEYIYVTVPAEYICVYHRILAMLADYGEDMLKDCKASCTDRNSGVIECFNMFNAAVAARKLGKDKLAETLIKYVKAKINQIYQGHDNSTSFVFPVDENGQLKAFVSCGERPRFEINPDDMELYEHKFDNGFDEHFRLGPEDESQDGEEPVEPEVEVGLVVELTPKYEIVREQYYPYTEYVAPCADIVVRYNGEEIDLNDTTYQYYFDDVPVIRFNDVRDLTTGIHNFKVVVTYNNETKLANQDLYYAAIS